MNQNNTIKGLNLTYLLELGRFARNLSWLHINDASQKKIIFEKL